ncbi:MAG TPA: trypsin-like peptidase domain-containing protein [Myxococcota bacterium]|nr:trypsin-like peptidase domain-containing protein [Myxococcota bacterium]
MSLRGARRSATAGALLIPLIAGCTFVKVESDRQLVEADDPVFDTRFRDVDPASLDLSHFWVEGETPAEDAAIPIDHRTYAKIVRSVSDGIVNLYTTVLEEREARIGIDPGGLLPFRIPLVSPVLDFIPFQMPIPYEAEGFSLGSGFLVNEGGFILTNAHVIRNATDIRVVRAKDREEFPARIIGVDPATDCALIRIEPQSDMKVLPLGDSEALDVGEIVLAVGNPLGLNHTVTSGLISAKERVVEKGAASLVDYLQTDTAINPGSSGGPLLNLHGQVVGITTAIATEAQNIGFAIPIDTVKRVIPILVSGNPERGWFGASARPARPGEAAELGHSNPSAVIIDEVFAASPASQAGVRTQDVIVRIGDEQIGNIIAFRRQLISLRPGSTLELTVLRDGEPIEIRSTLVARPSE